MDLNQASQVALTAARAGGKILCSRLGKIRRIDKKGVIDLVTEADLESEKTIIEIIRAAYPGHAIVAEESGLNRGNEDYRWFIDPLDGTTNFVHRIELFAVSIALVIKGKPAVAVVLNPATDELFTAVSGAGARRNGKTIRVSTTGILTDSLLATGFPANVREMIDPLVARFAGCLNAARGVRRLGSAALDLCYTACGRFDGFWEQQLNPWDTAAGVLVVSEAGGRITDFADTPFKVEFKQILATNGIIHDQMLNLLNTGKTHGS